ncbi:MAG: DNA translocase FtsK [candidate division KSB1 bacterium]|nr:DNA translocase FtsK [candidate division KSB1 bacterium]MDZ7334443.1 DNA translocase FtsK [candidate division KSB1 bacterium]MDZ7355970.1 DNA translocase FtsK [candidate division KSB1 bacterium]MDZ7375466.1 DNA translocase FtsK [candidate division KSB1 bacterium]MDZ7400696.1 DNA translocase FtsK [candidate division KSB1 bacterium]
MDIKKKQKIVGILLTSLGAFTFLSLMFFSVEDSFRAKSEIKNLMGVVGDEISRLLIIRTIGRASIVFPILIMLWGIHQMIGKKIKPIKKITIYALLFSIYISMTLAFYGMIRANLEVDETIGLAFRNEHLHWWGQLGEMMSEAFHGLFGTIGSAILFPTIVAITILYVFDIKFEKIKSRLVPRLTKFIAKVTGRYDPRKFKPKKPIPDIRDILELGRKPKEPTPAIFEPEEPEPALEAEPEAKFAAPAGPISEQQQLGEPAASERIAAEPRPKPQPPRKYYFPSAQILDEPVGQDDEVTWDELMNSAKTLEEKLADFGIQGKVVEINPGPVITRFELEPGLGVKINRFTSLADDLALVMRAKRIRVVAPIPGKAAIGVEIPNRKPSTVYIKSVIDSPQFRSAESPLTMALGKTIAGEIYVDDLARMPHLLIAGATGSGKSVCLNTIIASILFKAHPSQVQLVLIDPKRLELSVYAALKNHHLAYRPDLEEEVVTNPNNAVAVLRSLEMEMERRYELLAKAGVRNIEDYNNWIKALSPEQRAESIHQRPLEYVVLIIDELADLMLVAAREVEEPIARLTQMSRAVGIHLIVATQRPSVDVITGVIKANFPARIAFQVASKTDSRTILDMNGAEKLLGRGDMLFLPPGSPEPIRIHGAYISHEEVKRIVEHIHQQPPQEPKFLLPTGEDEATANYNRRFRDERDELFNEALKLVVRHQQGSVSLLQRRLKIGYARAARLIDQLEEAGFVGPFDGSKAREVLADEEQLKEMGIY